MNSFDLPTYSVQSREDVKKNFGAFVDELGGGGWELFCLGRGANDLPGGLGVGGNYECDAWYL